MFQGISIQRKLASIIVVTSTLPIVLAFGALIVYGFAASRNELATELTTLADVAAANSTSALVFADRHSVKVILSGLRAEKHILAACVYDRDGYLFASYIRPPVSSCPTRSAAPGMNFRRGLLFLSRTIDLDGERLGAVYLEAGLDGIYQRLENYTAIAGIVLLSCFLIAMFLSIRFQRILSRPILDLANTAQLVSRQKDYSLRVRKGANDEVGFLIDAFNGMLAQIGAHAAKLTEVNRELTKSKEAAESSAEALARSEKRFRSTFDEAPICMHLIDRNGCVVAGNRASQQMLGFSTEELRGIHFAEFTHCDDVASDAKRFQKFMQDSSSGYQVEKRYRRKDGKTVWSRMTVSRLHMDKGEFLAIAMAEDTTERRQLEEQLRQAQKMEAIGRLAGGVAHDFNNLLTVIKGNTELCIKRLGDHQVQRNLAQVAKGADRAAALVDQLLAFSRKQLVDPRVLDLNAAIRDLQTMLGRLIGEDIELIVNLAPDAGFVTADPVQLEQIVLNLAVNARDAMPQGGRLIIATESRMVDASHAGENGPSAGSYVVLSMQDTGMGMNEETRLHIFEPFFTTKEVGKGTGLGLSTVYGIVQQAGGFVVVDSEEHHGAKFAIHLPRANHGVTLNGNAQPPENTIAGGGEKILVVEDEASVRAMLCETLADRGYTVIEARNGEHALEVAAEHAGTIQMLLTDVVMPRLNGCELAERILALWPATNVLYMSGYTEEKVNRGAAFLKKPFTPEQLARKVRSVLDSKKAGGLEVLSRPD